MHIGLLEDDTTQIDLISYWVHEIGADLKSYTTGKSFCEAFELENFDLLILDWQLPDTTGIKVLDWLRYTQKCLLPILFITSRDSEDSVVEALEHGANDYMIKPVSKKVTLARIKSLLRQHKGVGFPAKSIVRENNVMRLKPFTINQFEKSISVDNEVISLTNKEFELAYYLFSNIGSLISRETLLEVVWGTQADLNTRTVDTHISRIRAKLGIKPANGWILKSVYQKGYRLSQFSEAAE